MVFQNIKRRMIPRAWKRSEVNAARAKDAIRMSDDTFVHVSNENEKKTTTKDDSGANADNIVIVGGGIVGLVLALALHHHGVCQQVQIFEQAPAFHEDVGAGMSLYPNGLRVIRDISPELLKRIQEAGYPYQYRHWMRHDGTEIAIADETVLARRALFPLDKEKKEEQTMNLDLRPIGIRRWILQKILYDAVLEAGILVHFGKRLDSITESTDDVIDLQFEDGTVQKTKLLLAADGAKSKVRSIVTGGTCQLKYIGTTCLMGTSTTPQKRHGLSLPASPTTKCHGAFYPTSETDQCFQFHFPNAVEHVSSNSLGGWGGMTQTMSQEECQELAAQLEKDGWDDESFLQPLQHVEKALQIGLTTLDPPLKQFTFHRVVLVGDAAHPPVPYLGQGAQQGLEDAGTLTLLLQNVCLSKNENEESSLSLERLQDALQLYNELRVPRTSDMVEQAKLAGHQQQKRAENSKYNRVREEKIQREVFYYENSCQLFVGVNHDYKEAVENALKAFEDPGRNKIVAQPDETTTLNPDNHHLSVVPEGKE